MSSFPSALRVSPSSREYPCDPVGGVLSHGGCLTSDHGQMLGPELVLTEMSEVELAHLIQTHMDAHVAPPNMPIDRSHPATVIVTDATGISPSRTTQAIDLSTTTYGHCLVMPEEKTPTSYGEVPDFVLARVRDEDRPTEPRANSSASSQDRSGSTARVCLEKRFNTLFADTPRKQEIQSAVFSNFLTMFQQSTEAPEAAIHPQMHMWMKTGVSSPFLGGVFNPVANMCEQVISHIPHMVEPKTHQGLILPKNYTFTFHKEMVGKKAHFTSGSNSTQEQQLMNTENDMAAPAASRMHGSTRCSQPDKAASAAPGGAGESGCSTTKRRTHILRRERHNIKERERRKRIRLYCDELNLLVPFCNPDSDKVTTLQWTAAFLRYIKVIYGDAIKEEFQKTYTDDEGHFLPSSLSSDQDETLSIPLAVEQ